MHNLEDVEMRKKLGWEAEETGRNNGSLMPRNGLTIQTSKIKM